MDIAQRIQELRKAKGLSQEELADRIGVSRQAVSKWESAQSLPEYDKLIMLSDFFEVTTDYLMRGTMPTEAKRKHREQPHAGVFAAAASALTLIGVIFAVMMWFSEKSLICTTIGFIFVIMGCMVFIIGMFVSDPKTKASAKTGFLALNIWVVPFMPFSILVNLIAQRSLSLWVAPYPELLNKNWGFVAFCCLVYIVACTIVCITLIRKFRRDNR